MNAKKLACLLLIGAMLTSLTACGSTAEVDTALSVLKDEGIDAYVIGTIIKGEEKVILE